MSGGFFGKSRVALVLALCGGALAASIPATIAAPGADGSGATSTTTDAPDSPTGPGTLRGLAGGYRSSSSNTAEGYSDGLEGATLEYDTTNVFSTPISLPLTDAAGLTTASVSTGTKYGREKAAPSGWRPLSQLTWGGSTRNYVGSANVTSGGTSTLSVDPSRSSRFVYSLDNPTLPSECGTGLKVLLLLDTSGSTSGHDNDYNKAAKTFVSTLGGTPTKLKISSFATTSSPDNSTEYDLSGSPGQTAANSRIDSIYPNNTSGSGWTNWDQALKDAAGAGVDVVVFVTDGNPTIRQGGSANSSGGIDDITFGVASANSAKNPDGTSGNSDDQTMLAVGVGSGLSSANLSAVSGPTEGKDYTTTTDPTTLAETLKQIAAKICGGSLKVIKKVDPATDPGTFNLTIDGEVKSPKGLGDGGSVGPFDVPTGKHEIGEEAGSPSTDLADYTVTKACSDKDGNVPIDPATGKFEVGTDQAVTCTITNHRKSGTLTITKKITGIDTGDLFNLLIDGDPAGTGSNVGDGGTTGPVQVTAGDHTVTESGSGSTSLSDYSSSTECLDGTTPVTVGPGGKITIADGQKISCTITNDRKTGQIELIKNLVPSDDPGRFDLQIDGFTAASDVGDGGTTGLKTVTTGPHTVGELSNGTDLSHYSRSIACFDGATPVPVDQSTGALAVTRDGEVVKCTITNTHELATLTLTKSLDPTTDDGKFDLLINGDAIVKDVGNGGTTGSVKVEPGKNSVGENASGTTGLSDYKRKITCLDGTTPVTVDQSTGELEVAADHKVDCTITNTRLPGTLKVIKSVAGPAESTARFDFLVDGTVQLPKGLADGESVGPSNVSAGTHTITEQAGNAGTDLADYDQEIACSDSTGPLPVDAGEVKVNSSADVVCTVTNTRKSGSITLSKKVVWPDPAPSDTGRFNLQVNGVTKLADATDGQSTPKTTVPTGSNTIGETAGTGTDLAAFASSYSCSDSKGPVTVDQDGKLTVTKGQDISCTVTNTRKTGTVTVVKKITGPDDGSSRFDLQVDGVSRPPLGLGDGGKTDPVTVATGEHTVGEVAGNSTTDPGDFTRSTACADSEGPVSMDKDGKFEVSSGQDVTCTITNDRKAGTLTLTKKVVWPDPVPADTGRFNLQVNGVTKLADATDGQSTSKVTVATGANTVGETAGTATDLGDFSSAYSCVDAEGPVTVDKDGKLEVDAGQDVSCTVTNTRLTGTLKLVKKVVWPDPAPSDTGRFNLQVNGVTKLADATSGQGTEAVTVPSGSNTVGETAGTGTTLADFTSAYSCSDSQGPVTVDKDGKLEVDAGQEVTCTVTNTRNTGSITLTKKVVWPDPVPADTGRFNLQVNGATQLADATNGQSTSKVTVATGANSIGETAGTGTTLVDFTSAYSCSDSQGPVTVDKDGNLSVTSGEDVSCTVTNTRLTGTLKVTKKVVWPEPVPADTGKFDLQVNGATKLADATDGQSTDAVAVPSGSNTFGETAGTGTDLASYTATTTCSDSSGDVPVSSGAVTVDPGQDVTCTITNTLKTGRLTIVKNVSGGSTTAFPFTGPLGPFTLTDKQSESWDLAPGKWSVTEGTTTGFTLTGLSCVNTGEGGPAVVDGSKVTVDLIAGEDITCTYTNAPGGILPSRSGTARLLGTTGCAVGTYATERVIGTFIAKVVWYVNGKRRSTLTKPNSSPYWQLRYPVAALNYGRYSVRAEVRFRRGVTPRYRLLRTAFSRCLPPRATG